MIRQVISDMVHDMVRNIVQEEVTILREEVQSDLQSFYERISILIESSYAHPAPGPSSPLPLPPPPPSPPPPEAGKEPDLALDPFHHLILLIHPKQGKRQILLLDLIL